VVVVRNQDTKAALASMIEPTLQSYVAQRDAGEEPWNTINPTAVSEADISTTEIPRGMVDKISYAPVVLLVFVDLSVVSSFDSELDRIGLISGASIYPFAWNILLGARNEGYGGTMTTFVVGRENELKELLGVPDEYACAAMIPLGKPVEQLTKLSRKPVATFAFKEQFGGASF
jgi:nitroreductase